MTDENRAQNGGDLGSPRPPRRTAWVVAFALVCALWLTWFYPVLFGHQSISVEQMLDHRITGEAGLQQRRSSLGSLKSKDASLLQIHWPLQAFLARHWSAGHYPQWNPLVGCGQPGATVRRVSLKNQPPGLRRSLKT